MNIDTTGWTKIGVSENAEFFEIDTGVLAVVPTDGSVDNAATAKQSVARQHEHLRSSGRCAGVVVFMDRVAHQDSTARAVYRDEPDPELVKCYALVGGTTFGRAVGSIFIGLHPPRVPTRMFGTTEEAIAWIREMLSHSSH